MTAQPKTRTTNEQLRQDGYERGKAGYNAAKPGSQNYMAGYQEGLAEYDAARQTERERQAAEREARERKRVKQAQSLVDHVLTAQNVGTLDTLGFLGGLQDILDGWMDDYAADVVGQVSAATIKRIEAEQSDEVLTVEAWLDRYGLKSPGFWECAELGGAFQPDIHFALQCAETEVLGKSVTPTPGVPKGKVA